jgi:hypothetical protein
MLSETRLRLHRPIILIRGSAETNPSRGEKKSRGREAGLEWRGRGKGVWDRGRHVPVAVCASSRSMRSTAVRRCVQGIRISKEEVGGCKGGLKNAGKGGERGRHGQAPAAISSSSCLSSRRSCRCKAPLAEIVSVYLAMQLVVSFPATPVSTPGSEQICCQSRMQAPPTGKIPTNMVPFGLERRHRRQ